MKLFLAITLIFSVSLIQAKDFPWKKVERKKPKIIKTNTERFLKNPEFKETPTDWIKSKKVKKGKRLELFKKKRSSFQANTTYKQGTDKGHLKPKDGDIQITEVQNGKENEVTIQISDPKGKYFVERVRYRIPGVLKELEVPTSLNDGITTANLDVSDVPFGVHTLKFEFISKKIKKQDKGKGHKKGHTKVFLGEATFEKKQLLFALFSVEHDANSPVVTLDAQESYSNSSQISEYTFKIYSDNELLESFSQTEPRLIHSFKEPGVYELSIVVKDGSGNFAESERQSVEITNSAPTLVYEMNPREGLPGHYNIDFTGSHDKDGQNIKYYRLLIHYDDNGETIYQGDLVWTVPTINFAAPESGRDYTLTIVVYDEDLNYTYEEIPFRYDGPIAPKYAWHYISDDDVMPHVKYIGAEFLDVDPIESYHYKATHEDGTVVYPWDDSTVQHTGIELVKPGKWTFEFYGIDSTGLKSDVGRETVEVLWEPSDLTPIIDGYYSAPSEGDPRVWYVGANFVDPLGEVVKYEFKATHTSGMVIHEERPNNANNELRFPIKGEWTIEVIATDNEGFTGSFSWTEDIQWDFDKASAELVFEQDSENPYAFFVTSVNSTPSIVKTYVSATHENGKSVVGEHAGEPNFWIDLYERGSWTVEYHVEDAFGLVSETATTVINIEPIVLNINIAQDPEVPRQYLLNTTGSYDPIRSSNNVDYRVVTTHESGERHEYLHYQGALSFLLRSPGKWNVEVMGIDSEYGVESGYYTENINVINKAPIAMAYHTPGWSWNSVSMNASGSYDPDGHISSYNYKFVHASGTSQVFSTANLIETFTLQELEGTWSYELTVVDNEGKESAIKSGSFELIEPNELPIASFEVENTADPYVIRLKSDSYDPDGTISAVIVEGQNDKGETLTKQFEAAPYELTLTPGIWYLNVKVIDNKNAESNPDSLNVEITPVRLAYEMVKGSGPYAYTLDATDTVAQGEVWLNVRVNFEGSEVYNQQHYELHKELNVFNKNGSYEIIVTAADGAYTTPELRKTLSQSLPNVGGDTIPEDPGEAADDTLLGIDSDSDGVRDDIELWVNSINELTNLQKKSLKEMSKTLQKHIQLGNDKQASVAAKFEEIGYGYCLEDRLGREPASQIMSEMRVNFYNTKERLQAWARGEVNFAGQAVVLDTDEENYEQYCNE